MESRTPRRNYRRNTISYISRSRSKSINKNITRGHEGKVIQNAKANAHTIYGLTRTGLVKGCWLYRWGIRKPIRLSTHLPILLYYPSLINKKSSIHPDSSQFIFGLVKGCWLYRYGVRKPIRLSAHLPILLYTSLLSFTPGVRNELDLQKILDRLPKTLGLFT